MKFVAPEQAPEQAEIIRNTPFWPDVDLSEFRSVMRTDGTGTQPRFNPVARSARAVVNARLQDYDATASGVKRGEELAEASGDLWRDARWAICRVQDAPHCTVELI
ncbi:head completion/stabilization protein [Escherichia marmotae]|nr:head completion/stabilization protein [Escherichia marmotae]